MASEQFDPRVGRGELGARADGAEPALGDQFRRLTADTGELVRQEVALAKAELRETGATLARDGAKIGIALGLALAGVLALTAFLTIILGDALNSYWLSSLIVGLVFLAIGAVLVRSAVSDIKSRGLGAPQTMASLREDAAWAKEEAGEVKRELTR